MSIRIVTTWLLGITLMSSGMGCRSAAAAQPLVLAENGVTAYVLTGDVDQPDVALAMQELVMHLNASTGAAFPIVPLAQAKEHDRRIIVGQNALSDPIISQATVATLHPEESVVLANEQDILLIGGSARASLYAAYSFLENEVGCRWYAAHLEPTIPRHEKLQIASVSRTERPSFSPRNDGANEIPDTSPAGRFMLRNRYKDINPPGRIDIASHTFFFYIPPHAHDPVYSWLGNYPPQSNFFETHPEFFTMNAAGNRVDNLQLCFSNPQLRKTLTSQIDAVIRKSKHRDNGYISLDANDVPGKLCHCDPCQKLEAKYKNIGGPFYDYLPELASTLAKDHPGVLIKLLAYRLEQTERPPLVNKLPDNVVVHFAPIDNNFAARLDHPTNRETLANFKQWRKIARHLWVWYYTNPYIVAGPPFANARMIASDIRLMRDLGLDATKFQQTTGHDDRYRGLNFADLETWMLTKLTRDPDQDIEPLIIDFLQGYYGSAAPLMGEYLSELEMLREGMTTSLPNVNVPSFSMFTYVTPPRIIRWGQMFDQMEKLVADNADALRHVRTARITLDVAKLTRWRDVAAQHADMGETAAELEARIQKAMTQEIAVRSAPGREQQYWAAFGKRLPQLLLKTQVVSKPLPAMFRNLPVEQVREILPPVESMTTDVDAACGMAAIRAFKLELPVTFGLYDDYRQKWSISRALTSAEIKPDVYHTYRLGRAALSPQCRVWMTDHWLFTVPLEEAYIEGDPLVEWDIHASLKFSGPKFGSADTSLPNTIACDRVILVRAQAGDNNP